MTGWTEFIAALGVFILSHAIPARPRMKDALRDVLGDKGYLGLYAGLSVLLLAWLVAAAGRAPYVALWPFQVWQMWVPNLLMPLACLLTAFGIGAPNPLSFGGSTRKRFDPDHPGIAGVSRHPLLLAILLWGLGHTVPNGDLAHVILFGLSAIFAALGMLAIDRRRQRAMGPGMWAQFAANTSLVPCAALLDGRWRPALRRLDIRRLLIGVALWAALLTLHPWVIGVSPMP